MTPIPSPTVILKNLADVPMSEYADIQPPKNSLNTQERLSFLKRLRKKAPIQEGKLQIRQLSFQAAVWLGFHQEKQKTIRLYLSYKDADGEGTVFVDEQFLKHSRSAMLSGSVHFKVKGHLEYLRVACSGLAPGEGFIIDELHIKRQELSANAARALRPRLVS